MTSQEATGAAMSEDASDTTIVSVADVPIPSRGLWWAMWACLAIGIALSGVLVWQGQQAAAALKASAEEGLDGCPTGGECEQVFSSPYGQILGFSLTKWNIVFYLVAGLTLLATTKGWQLSLAPPLSLMLPVITFIGVTAAVWSMAVMLFVLGQLCLVCTSAHALNSLLFVLSVLYVRQDWNCRQQQRWKAAVPPLPATPIKLHIAIGLLIATSQLATLTWFHGDTAATIQLEISSSVLGVHEVPANLLALLPLDAKPASAPDDPASDPTEDDAADDGADDGADEAETRADSAKTRADSVDDGADSAKPRAILWTSKGPRDAPHCIVVFSCPTCPKCARLHSVLNTITKAHPEQLRIDSRFYPLWHACNDAIARGDVGVRHRDACSIVRLTLAVAHTTPDKFVGYMDWLYEQGDDLTEANALAEAEKVSSKAAISKALVSDDLWHRFRTDQALAVRLHFHSVPQMYLAHGQIFGGVTADNLQQLLVAELGLVPSQLDDSGAPRIWVADHRVLEQAQLANALTLERRYVPALAAYRKALEMKPDWSEVLTKLAWLLATCRDDEVRDGQQALIEARLALRAFTEQMQGKEPTQTSKLHQGQIYDTMAAAQAELGEFDAAQDLVKIAIDRYHECDNKLDAERAFERLELYQKREPYRD